MFVLVFVFIFVSVFAFAFVGRSQPAGGGTVVPLVSRFDTGGLQLATPPFTAHCPSSDLITSILDQLWEQNWGPLGFCLQFYLHSELSNDI